MREERGDEHSEVMETLRQIQADVAELKARTRESASVVSEPEPEERLAEPGVNAAVAM